VLLGLAFSEEAGPRAGPFTLALYLGLVFAISAIPVISRILMDLGMMRTTAGTVILAAGFIEDFVALIAVSLLLRAGKDPSGFHLSALAGPALAAGFYALCLVAGRPLLQAALRRSERWVVWPGTFLSMVFLVAMACAAVTGLLGVHVIFGAFLAGVMMGGNPRFHTEAGPTLHDFVLSFFGPLFFGSVGLRTDLGAGFDLGLVLAVLAVACASKFTGAWAGARWGRLGRRDSVLVGIGLDARGMVGLVDALLGLNAGVLSQPLYGALILLAFLTSAAAGPLLKVVARGRAP
jgi:Kef-type K+ transport system membrane component KefB